MLHQEQIHFAARSLVCLTQRRLSVLPSPCQLTSAFCLSRISSRAWLWNRPPPVKRSGITGFSTCPELCHGLFLEGTGTRGDALPDPATLSVVCADGNGGCTDPDMYALLVAHVISTRSASPVVTDEDMAFPPGSRVLAR